MTLHEECINKLNPNALHCSGFFTSILACLLSEQWTTPAVAGICVTSDGFFLLRHDGDIGYNHFGGEVRQLKANLNRVAQTVDLSTDAWNYLVSLVPTPTGG